MKISMTTLVNPLHTLSGLILGMTRSVPSGSVETTKKMRAVMKRKQSLSWDEEGEAATHLYQLPRPHLSAAIVGREEDGEARMMRMMITLTKASARGDK